VKRSAVTEEPMINFAIHQARAGLAGAGEDFEQMLGLLVRATCGEANLVFANPGDWGIDVVVGDLGNQVTVWQAKYFVRGVSRSQQGQIRSSFASAVEAAAAHGYALARWVLCIPASMDGTALQWWQRWKAQQELGSGVVMDLWDETRLRELLLQPEAGHVRRHYYNPYRHDGGADAPAPASVPCPGLSAFRDQHALPCGRTEAGLRLPGQTCSVTGIVASAAEVRYSLPPDTAAFTGRGEELGQIAAAVSDMPGFGGVVAVRAIDGMPGTGKTALAVHAAHGLRGQFTDRQLFVDLHAHTPGREPVRPQDALAGLLAAAGVDTRHLPGDLDGRAAMWRDKMAGQRGLLVLDNAASTSQVAPLLPGDSGWLVLVTSRRHLGDLPGAVMPVLLGVLPPRQAIEMFIRLAPRAGCSHAEVAEVAELAGFLPLALSLLARVFARHRSWTLADLATETRNGLLGLTAEHQSIAAAFEVSYQHLPRAQKRLFCLLGLYPGTIADAYAAAALAGITAKEAIDLLDGLHGEGLLTEAGHRRYSMHDLLRRYARDHAATPGGDAQQALDRLLDYYQHTAARAGSYLARRIRPAPALAPLPGPGAAPELNDESQALAWAHAERATLLACLDHATSTGQHARVIALTAALAGLLRREGPWADAITRHTAAAVAAQCLNDRLSHAGALTDLGSAQGLTGDYQAASQALEHALGIYRDTGNRLGQANALSDLGSVQALTGDYQAASQALEHALGIYRDTGDRYGQANALSDIGSVWRRTGDYPAAAKALSQALAIFRDMGNRLGQADALYYLGSVQGLAGDYPSATQALEHALSIYRDTGNRLGQANALSDLGSVWRRTGDYPAAAKALSQALVTYRDIGNRGGEVHALNETGALHWISGESAQAEDHHHQALQLARAIASSWDEAHALAGLGRCAMASDDTAKAEALLSRALETFRRIGAAEVPGLLAELRALTGPRPEEHASHTTPQR
jgi:tetratricopeptide (TPR) repeat protein